MTFGTLFHNISLKDAIFHGIHVYVHEQVIMYTVLSYVIYHIHKPKDSGSTQVYIKQ